MTLQPQASWMVHAFLGAMLAATGVGITARVLQDAGALKTPFARIILGAAVIDDVLGLLLPLWRASWPAQSPSRVPCPLWSWASA